MTEMYTPEEKALLLKLSRRTLEAITDNRPAPEVDVSDLPPALVAQRACFVTLRRRLDGALRGCTGTLVARRPLAQEVIHMTVQTALHDPRFLPVRAHELNGLHVEISILTPPQPLEFDGPGDLLDKLRPGVDGVTLYLGTRRATFLPQVWESYPDPRVFLGLLAQKMGGPPEAWHDPALEAETYQAIIVEEPQDYD